MSSLFLTIWNMSLTASYVALLVIIVRWLFMKAKVPKIFSYALWALVLFRLTVPFSFESSISWIPGSTNVIPQQVVSSQSPAIDTEITLIDRLVNHSIQSYFPPANPADSVNPMAVAIYLGAVVWIVGVTVLLLYGLFSYFRLKHKLSISTLVKDHIYETDRIQTPFVFGMMKPRIYVPIGLSSQDLDLILMHEQTHIRRLDHWIKPIAFLTLAIHWFNPIVWLSYALMTKDMEMSCDETVMKLSSDDVRAEYSGILLALASRQSGLSGSLSFGKGNVRSRVRNILGYKKPVFGTMGAAFLIFILVAIGTMANPNTIEEPKSHAEQWLKYKTPYVGNASKVGNLLGSLEVPESYVYDYFALQTTQTPYGVSAYYKTDNSAIIHSPDETSFMRNAIVMFALIDNVDEISFHFDNGPEQTELHYTRGWAEDKMGRDVREFSRDIEGMKQLLRSL